MQLAVRPYITAGVALAGASIIAAAPVAQHLPELEASAAVRLASTEQTITDLFSGAANNVTNFAASAVDVPGNLFSPAAADPYFVNPLQTWVELFQGAGADLQSIFGTWAQSPAVLSQQVAANFIEYGSEYIGAFQNAAFGAANFYTGTNAMDFVPLMASAISAYQAGDMTDMINDLYTAIYTVPLVDILQPLETSLNIPIQFTQNIANTTNFFLDPDVITGKFIPIVGSTVLTSIPGHMSTTLGADLQSAHDALAAGLPQDALLQLLNIPGSLAKVATLGIVNPRTGVSIGGLLATKQGLFGGVLTTLLNYEPRLLAQTLALPDAANIANGDSLAAAFQQFLVQMFTNWPSAQEIVSNIANLFQLYGGVGSAGAAAAGALPVDFAAIAPSVAAQFSAVAPSIAADLSALAPSIAADLSAVAPSIAADIAGTLSTNLGTAAANILMSLL